MTKVIGIIIGVFNFICDLLSGCYFMRPVYLTTGFLTTRKFAPAKKQHKYGVLIAARNEEAVIGNLIDSIREQEYPQELVDIFVVADNCTDKTAEVARQRGAICYERFDSEHKTKGFALQYLVECIRRDYGIYTCEGYLIFDADNLLKRDFLVHMNDSFDAGEKIVTSYRNTKNFDDNWITASYGLHWLRTVITEHRARSMFRLACRIQGTGFLFAAELIENGWNYTGFTEDRAFSADAVAKGYRISFNNEAEFYDEQPTDLRIAFRQRIRWAKGHLQAVAETGPTLVKHIFVTGGVENRHLVEAEGSRKRRFFKHLHMRFISYDMLTTVFPYGLIQFLRKMIVFVLEWVLILTAAKAWDLGFVKAFLIGTASTYLFNILMGAAVFFMERKRIIKIKWYKKVWYCIMFPMFDFIGKLSSTIALFKKVEWKPIPHTTSVTISEMDSRIND